MAGLSVQQHRGLVKQMKIGALEVYWHPGENSMHQVVMATMKTHPAFRALVAKIARAEVKNYLAEIAEQAELPFCGPVEFIRELQKK
jgi:hypothetical protein